jgi:hypothetical protein
MYYRDRGFRSRKVAQAVDYSIINYLAKYAPLHADAVIRYIYIVKNT